jgi:cardiolipin synthase
MKRRIKPVVWRKKLYIVYKPRKGEKLSNIAKRFSLANPELIYNHKKNWRFRALNKDPQNIKRRVKLFIPIQKEEALPPHVIKTGDMAPGNKVKYLIDGSQAFPEIEAALLDARKNINVQSYIFHNDRTGKKIAKILLHKARDGIPVNVLVDSFGAMDLPPLDQKMRKAGVKVVYAAPMRESVKYYLRDVLYSEKVTRKARFEARGLDNRDHRKLIVVDGKVAFLGGLNIGDEYSGYRGKMWHDVHARVEGPVVNALQSHFFERWMTERGSIKDIDLKAYFPKIKKQQGGIPVEVVTTLPGVKREIWSAYHLAIRKAKRYILIENAYLVCPRIIRSLKRARKKRGVDITIIVPMHFQDVPMIQMAMESVFYRLTKKGIKVLEYPDRMCHTKVAVVDGKWATIGSANLDNRSFVRDSELNIVVWDKKFIKGLERDLFKADMKISKPVKKPIFPRLAFIRSWLFLKIYRFL